MSLAPSGNERLGAPGQPAVVVNRRVRAPADDLAEAAVPRLLAGAPLHVRQEFRLQAHVHVIEAEACPTVGGGHVREPTWEPAPVQVVVRPVRLLRASTSEGLIQANY